MVSSQLLAKLGMETIGTALLVFTIGCAAGQGQLLAALAIGCTLMCAIYAGGHISGAHYNPAVTTAILIRGKISVGEAAAYIASQLVGAFVGGGSAAFASTADVGYPKLGSGVGVGSAFLAEVILTFALAHTVLHVATSTAQANNHYYGLAIGWTVLSGAISVGGISGGCFNPAVAMLDIIAGEPKHIWIHVGGPFVGGALAGLLFLVSHGRDDTEGAKPAGAYIVEFVGTFMLCFTVGVVASNPLNVLGAIGIGAILMSQVFAGGATSGAMYNPAVTAGVYLRRVMGDVAHSTGSAGKKLDDVFSFGKAFAYIVVQVVASVAAGCVAKVVLGMSDPGAPGLGMGVTRIQALYAEFWATTMLVFVVLSVATASKTSGNNFFGLAIGLTVMSMAIAVGGVSGGAFNPAVGMLTLWHSSSYMWLYWVGPMCGGVLAALIFRVVSLDDFTVEPEQQSLLKHEPHAANRRQYSRDASVDPDHSGHVHAFHADNEDRRDRAHVLARVESGVETA